MPITKTLKLLIDGLNNPRSLLFVEDDKLLAIEAGSGDFARPDSRLIRIHIESTEQGLKGEIGDAILQNRRSMNMLQRMHRDEIVGLCHVTQNGSGEIFVSLTDYIDGSKILCVSLKDKEPVHIQGHINSFCHDAKRETWFGVKSDANTVFAIDAQGQERLVTRFAALPEGQDAVPVCIIPERGHDTFLVSLFSGEVLQQDGMTGIGFKPKAGKIVRIFPDSGAVEDVHTGLTLPTGMAMGNQGMLYVLELCDAFLQPLATEASVQQTLHGGFRRFSGRLLRINLAKNHTEVLTTGLDTPSNLALHDDKLYISEGMGMPGRRIPDPQGQPVTLTGRIRYLEI